MGQPRSSLRPPLRRGFLAGAVVFLTLIGTGTAAALWSTQESVDPFTADAATVGVSHTVGAGLTHTYTSTALTAAQSVVVTNTGNREAAFSVAVSAASASDLRSHVTARLAVVANAAACTPSATLSSPTTGLVSSPVTLTSAAGALAAGASVTVCVQTAMSAVVGHGGKSLNGTVVSATTASAQSGWAASTTAVAFAQTVASGGTPMELDGNARYWIRNALNDDYCVWVWWGETANNGRLQQNDSCNSETSGHWTGFRNELWRFYDAGDGFVRIENQLESARNVGVTTASAGELVRAQSATGATKQWAILDNGDGTANIQSRANPLLCAAITGSALDSNPGHAETAGYLELVACNSASPNQRFLIDMFEIIIPPPFNLNTTCNVNNSGNFMSYHWPKLAGYETDTLYRILLDGNVLAPSGYQPNPINNWATQLQFSPNATLNAFGATHGFGAKNLTVQLSVLGGPWTDTATGSFVYASGGVLKCAP